MTADVEIANLRAGSADLQNLYSQFELTQVWGTFKRWMAGDRQDALTAHWEKVLSFSTQGVRISTSYRPEDLRVHLGLALKNGVTKEEIGELITHLAFYAGWPASAAAAGIAGDVSMQTHEPSRSAMPHPVGEHQDLSSANVAEAVAG